MAADAYLALAEIYDPWQEKYGAFWKSVLPKLLDTWARYECRPTSFVDLGCGTGSLLLALRRRSRAWRLCGLDASAAMLAQAQRKSLAETVEWVHAPFDAGLPGATFDAAGAFFDAFNHMLTPAHLARTLGAVAARLNPGGLLAFDLNNQCGFEAWWQGRRKFVGPDWALTIDATWDDTTRTGRGVARIQRRTADQPTHVTDVTERCFSTDEVLASLRAADLDVVTVEPWSPMPGDAPGKTWWVARRRHASG